MADLSITITIKLDHPTVPSFIGIALLLKYRPSFRLGKLLLFVVTTGLCNMVNNVYRLMVRYSLLRSPAYPEFSVNLQCR